MVSVINNNKYLFIKMAIDRFLALILFFVLIIIPVFPIIAILIKIESPGPIFYYQKRIGKNGKEFNMIKFRSMYIGSDSKLKEQIKSGDVNALNFKENVQNDYTKIGKFIRKTSIDELPQLINIIKGDMSVVGPRPIQQFEMDSYIDYNDYGSVYINVRNLVLPGLLCYWQISPNKNEMDFNERMDLDVKYTKELSFKTDVKILIKGIITVFSKNNI